MNKGYVLHFARNLYCMFTAIKKDNYFYIKRVINSNMDPHLENTDTN